MEPIERAKALALAVLGMASGCVGSVAPRTLNRATRGPRPRQP